MRVAGGELRDAGCELRVRFLGSCGRVDLKCRISLGERGGGASERAMKKLMCLLVAASSVLYFGSGCASVGQSIANSVPKPEVNFERVRLGGLSPEALSLEFDLGVKNNMAIPLNLAGFDYDFQIENNSFMKNAVQKAVKVPGNGTGTITVPVTIPFQDLYNAYNSFGSADSFNYLLSGGVSVNVPGWGPLRVPLKHGGELPIVKPPSLNINSFGPNPAGGGFLLDLGITNPNSFGVDLNKMNYGLELNGRQVLQRQTITGEKLAGGGSTSVQVPIKANLFSLGMGVFDLLKGNQKGLNWRMTGDVDLGTEHRLMRNLKLPFDKSGTL